MSTPPTDYTIQLEQTFDAGHRIVGHKGKCARLHGHTYRVQVEITSSRLVDPGFVIDFGDVKEEIMLWDHRMLLWDQDPVMLQLNAQLLDTDEDVTIEEVMRRYESAMGIVRLPFNPTAENMAYDLAQRIWQRVGNANASLGLRLWETPKASASVLL